MAIYRKYVVYLLIFFKTFPIKTDLLVECRKKNILKQSLRNKFNISYCKIYIRLIFKIDYFREFFNLFILMTLIGINTCKIVTFILVLKE